MPCAFQMAIMFRVLPPPTMMACPYSWYFFERSVVQGELLTHTIQDKGFDGEIVAEKVIPVVDAIGVIGGGRGAGSISWVWKNFCR